MPKPTYTDVFSDWLCDAAAAEPRLYGITPAMREGSGLVRFSKEYPQRYFDVAIAEQHAVTLAAGMATQGASRWWRSTRPSARVRPVGA